MQMTPLKLSLLMHFYAHADDPENIASNSVSESVKEFLDYGLITQALEGDGGRLFKTTILGDRLVVVYLKAAEMVLDSYLKAVNISGCIDTNAEAT